MGERVWIDNPLCKPFVENVVTAFNTKQPPKLLLMSDTWATSGRDTSSPLTVNSLEDDEGTYLLKKLKQGIKLCLS